MPENLPSLLRSRHAASLGITLLKFKYVHFRAALNAMTYSLRQLRQSGQQFCTRPAVKRSAIGVLIFILLIGLFGYFVLPGIIKSQAEKIISEKLHRQTTIEKVDINPYTMRMTMHGFKMMEPEGDVTFVSFDSVMVNLSAQSLFRFAPVVQQLQVVKPYLHLVRKDANHYNIDDLIALMHSAPESEQDKKPARFSIFNIQIAQGHIAFDDRFAQTKHTVADLTLGIPFISSLPSQEDIYVEPYLSASVNGTPFLVKGKTLPFANPVEATMDFDLDNLDLTSYLKYIPGTPHFSLPSAHMDLHLIARFQQPRDKAPALSLSGDIKLKDVQLNDAKGSSIAKLHQLAINLNETKIFSDQFAISRLTIDGLDADIARDRAGHFNFENLLTPPKPAVATAANAAGSPINAVAPSGKPPAAANADNPASATSAEHAAVKKAAAAESAPRQTQFVLAALDIRNTSVRYSDAQQNKPLKAGVKELNLGAQNISLDPAKKIITIGNISSNSAAFNLQQGKVENKTATAVEKSRASGTSKQKVAKADNAYIVNVAKIDVSNWSAKMQDNSLQRPSVTVIAPLSLTMQNLSTAAKARAQIDLQAKVNKTGQLQISGDLGLAPLHARLALNLQDVDIMQLQPYFTDQINILMTRAEVSSKGTLLLDQNSKGDLVGSFKGDVTLGNVTTVDKITSQNFLRWKSLAFKGMDLELAPFSLAVDHVLLDNFFARVIIDPKGRINLQDVQRSNEVGKKSVTDADAASHPGAKGTEKSATSSKSVAVVAPEKPASPLPPIKIKKLTLSNGRVRFTDNFIKPNYTANLEKFGGVITGLSSDEKTRANVDLKGEVNDAPLAIAGTINPLKRDLSLDLKAEIHGMELAPLSPYSGRYIGYGIEKGKLSFEVAYQVENRVLTAQNRLILDQLTLGDKVESPTATTLPVRFALALLRDRNGVIDLNLPIGGSLDDPQFSVGGLIVKVIVNLLSKAVTAPFTLLSSMLGGGEELSFLPFDAGQSRIDSKSENKLKTIAKALVDRPTLKLEITAHADPKVDTAGLKRAAIDRKVKALKLKDLVQNGKSADPDQIKISDAEYPKLLDRVYKNADFKKQRNFIGIQKDLPVPEMEKLLMEHTTITDDNLQALANRRAQSVKNWLVTEGKVPTERIFVLASKLGASNMKNDKAAPTSRVDFSLK